MSIKICLSAIFAGAALMGALSTVQAQQAPIKIGVVLPLTGNPAVSGLTNQAGMQLYLDSIKYKAGGRSLDVIFACLLYTSPSPRDGLLSRMPSSA